jgi:outer membrane protein OmpA-like peptidoglycan-associated protein/uncharacterized protein YidB (DUF937 family)
LEETDMTLSDTFTANRGLFDGLIREMADRFGLGASAGPLVQEVVNLITNSSGGIGGFLNALKSTGLGSEITSWLGDANAAPLPVQDLNRVISPSVLGEIASRVGLSTSAVAPAIAYVLPKLIGILTPGGKIPGSVSSAIQTPPVAPRVSETFRTAPSTRYIEQVPARQIGVIHEEATDQPNMMGWLWPLLGALAILGLGSYLLSNANRTPPAPVAVQTPAVPPPPAVATQPARLTLTDDDGVIHYSGSVHDEETRNSIINSLKAVFGADRIQGDIGIDLNRGAAPWLANFREALGSLNVPGVQGVFDGNSVRVGGLVSDSDRDRISNSLRGVLGSGLVVGALGNRVADLVSSADSKVLDALNSFQGSDAGDLVGILNQSIINFPSGSSQVPEGANAFLQKAAAQMKRLNPGTVIEVAGYTDNTGDAAANVSLSQQRAEAVRNALIRNGVNPAMLVAKGYGGANPIANNDLLEGRFRNRRIEYRVVKS